MTAEISSATSSTVNTSQSTVDYSTCFQSIYDKIMNEMKDLMDADGNLSPEVRLIRVIIGFNFI